MNRPEVNWRAVPPSDGTMNKCLYPFKYPTPSNLYTNRSITLAGAAHSAPLGGVGRSTLKSAPLVTVPKNAIWLPSGDQLTPWGPVWTFVNIVVSPVSIHRLWIWLEPEELDT